MTLRAIHAKDVAPRSRPSVYPPVFAAKMAGRIKQALGDAYGLTNFGVNRVRLVPGSQSALHHRHARQDEFVFVLEGTPTLIVDDAEQLLGPGMCVGFRAGGSAHHLENRSDADAVYLEIGDRTPNDRAQYPHDDLVATQDDNGAWVFTRKDGSPW